MRYILTSRGNTTLKAQGPGFHPFSAALIDPVVREKSKTQDVEITLEDDIRNAIIISADKLYHETGVTLDRGYKSLISEETDFDAETFKTDNTVWVNADKIIDLKPIINFETNATKQVIRQISPPNPLTSKNNISSLEAHLRLNHSPAKSIMESIKINIFDDVSAISDTETSTKM